MSFVAVLPTTASCQGRGTLELAYRPDFVFKLRKTLVAVSFGDRFLKAHDAALCRTQLSCRSTGSRRGICALKPSKPSESSLCSFTQLYDLSFATFVYHEIKMRTNTSMKYT